MKENKAKISFVVALQTQNKPARKQSWQDYILAHDSDTCECHIDIYDTVSCER